MSKWSEIFKLWNKPEEEQYVEIPLKEYEYLKKCAHKWEEYIFEKYLSTEYYYNNGKPNSSD